MSLDAGDIQKLFGAVNSLHYCSQEEELALLGLLKIQVESLIERESQ